MERSANDRVYFTINGKEYSAGGEFAADTYLNEFIRRNAGLRGTKFMCLEGGCGACVVYVEAPDSFTHEITRFSVNSCLVAVLSCNGWDITTIEGIGNRNAGYNIIQKRLNHYFGSQCGYCSPGFVMSMYSLAKSSENHLTEEDIEQSFGSNLCRCTGYRPILEAFKSLASNPNPEVIQKIKDIEDIDEFCLKSGKKCTENCDWYLINCKEMGNFKLPRKISLVDGRSYYTVNNIRSIFDILNEVGYDSYMLLAGNTSRGVRPIVFYPAILIDINNVVELKTYHFDDKLSLGANLTLTDTMNIFLDISKRIEGYWYLEVLYDHMKDIAHIPVRNIATLAGNLVLKHNYPDFQSDIFLLLDCVGATLVTVDSNQTQMEMSMPEFLEANLIGKVLTHIKVPPLSRDYKIVTYKITCRQQNAHAEVNSGFLFKLDPDTDIVREATLVYGGINSQFTHAYKTEQCLIGEKFFNNETLQKALFCLQSEISPSNNPPEPSPYFRIKLAISLFYKCVIKLCPKYIINPIYESGSTTSVEDRPPVCRSYQEYDTDQKVYPITQSLLKKEGIFQCAGETVYSDDLPTIKGEVFAAFVLSTVTKADIESIDSSEALKVDGVYAVLTSADIPGVNSVLRKDFLLMYENEELLASEKILYYNQPIAIIVAKTQILADKMTHLVKVNYKNIPTTPVIFTIADAIKAPKQENRLVPYPGIVPIDVGTNTQKIIKGKFVSPRQYHNMMELHTCVTMPVDDKLEVYSSTQFLDMVQAGIAQLLNIPENLVIVKTRSCGGGFGCKIGRSQYAACASALVAKTLNKTCRMSMRLTDIMRATGKRPDALLDYEVGVDNNGEIQYMDAVFYVNDGVTNNENQNTYSTDSLINCYNPNRWKVDSFAAITDAPTNCFMRAPGGFEGISGIEHVMEHIAAEIKKDPIAVRFANYRKDDNQLPDIIPMFLERIDYEERLEKTQQFNAHNRWKKRAIRLTNMSFPTAYIGNYGALVSIYHGDGSVIINTGGIEIGQGIFTRCAQVAANEFGIPVEMVKVLPSVNFATPNNFATASSITTECCAYAIIRCCEQINERLGPIRAIMPTASWKELVFQADRRGILLQANYQTSENDPRLINYSIFGVTAIEVEIDILTGTKWIVRADIFEDAGRSINPALDVGQVEGAFVQGLSLWVLENTIYDEGTGEIYTDRTWNYKIMGAKDIPYDFRVYLRRRAPNPVGILGSKAAGEPPICMGHVVVDALRVAIQASRDDSGYETNGFLDLDVPVTNENVVKAANARINEFLLY